MSDSKHANESKETKGSWTTSVSKDGAYKRKESQFRSSIGDAEFPAEPNRYHLYIAAACPWANRTVIMRALKGLEDIISVSVVDPFLDGKTGWTFTEPEPINKFTRLRQVYELMDSNYEGNVTVPVLFDKKTNKIVNNESSEIIRQLNTQFNKLSSNQNKASYDYYPQELRSKIDLLNERIYPTINNGVYRCGFATSQSAYNEAFNQLFESLDWIENTILNNNRYLVGDRLTEADIRLFTTLIRFDCVYYTHFKTNGRRIIDYPNIWNYVLELYSVEEIQKTINFKEIKQHYFESHKSINPHGIVPLGPFINYNQSNDRDQKFPNVKAFKSYLQ